MKQSGLALVGILIVAFLFTGCHAPNSSEHEPSIIPTISPISTPTNKQAEYRKLLPNEAQAMMSDEVIILDVRTQEEYDEGHIVNAVLLPDNEIQEKVETMITDKTQTILVYCRTGRRSERASRELIDLGYENVYDFGGIVDWTGEIVGNWLYPSYYNYFGDTLPPDIVTPIDFTTTQKICDQMPEFTFHLTGNNVKSYGVSYDNTKYYIMFDENKIESITITDNTGALVQKIDDLITENPASEEGMYGLSFNDWNFDGYFDIGLWSYRGGTMRNDPHYYWLWDSSLGQFVENAELMEISDFSTISINVEEGRLECYTRFGSSSGLTQEYEYIDDKFVMVYSITFEIEQSPDEEDKYIRHITITELVDGELKITEDYYEDIEE
jgi:phage shock protein E